MNLAKFLQAFGLVALMACVSLVTQSLTVNSMSSENVLEKEDNETWGSPHLGQVAMFAGNFAPRGWALCNGQLLSISSNQALFSILGTTYGGDGRTTFGLPDLRGRAPIHAGRGPGLSDYSLGQKGGQERVTLSPLQMPRHNHVIQNNLKVQDIQIARPRGEAAPFKIPVVNGRGRALEMTSAFSGAGQAIENRQPYQVINYIIALQGVYPSRS